MILTLEMKLFFRALSIAEEVNVRVTLDGEETGADITGSDLEKMHLVLAEPFAQDVMNCYTAEGCLRDRYTGRLFCFIPCNARHFSCIILTFAQKRITIKPKGEERMNCNVTIRMDADIKEQADALFAALGMNLSTAFNIFVRQSLREGGLPFQVRLEQPNRETIEAMLEAEKIARDPDAKRYHSVRELFEALERDEA